MYTNKKEKTLIYEGTTDIHISVIKINLLHT